MKKRIIMTCMTAALLLGTAQAVCAENNNIAVYYDAQQINFDVQPQIIDGRTMVPLRAIFETLGAEVVWDEATQTITATKDDITIKMVVNSKEMMRNSTKIMLDVPPQVVNGRTLVPVRAIAETFGVSIYWSEPAEAVSIYPKGKNVNKTTVVHPDGRVSECDSNVLARSEQMGWIPQASAKQMWSLDGRTMYTYASNVEEYKAVGWYENEWEVKQTLYAPDGRTATVFKAEVPAYTAVGWFENEWDVKQTIYAPDGRTATVLKSEVAAYTAAGWSTTQPSLEDLCVVAVKKYIQNMKNPSSVKLYSVYAGSYNRSNYNEDASGTYFAVVVDIAGQNSYGGMTRDDSVIVFDYASGSVITDLEAYGKSLERQSVGLKKIKAINLQNEALYVDMYKTSILTPVDAGRVLQRAKAELGM